jgi:hypothetical protein
MGIGGSKIPLEDEVCPRVIVIRGIISSVSHIGLGRFSGSRLWIPSSVESIARECAWKIMHLKSVLFEPGSMLERLDSMSFVQTELTFLQVPASLSLLCQECFSECASFSMVRFESGSTLS